MLRRLICFASGFAGIQLVLSFCCAAGQTEGSQRLCGLLPSAVTRLQPLQPLPDATILNLAVALPLRNKEALDRLLQQVYDPASPKFHCYLSLSEFTDQFGPTKRDYQSLIDFARTHHFKITGQHPNRTLLDVSASVAEIRRVLHVNINIYPHPAEPRTFYSPDRDPSLDLDIPILAIKGLDSFNLPRATFKKTPMGRGNAQPMGGSGPGGGYIGKDFREAYAPGVSLTGAGQTAALVEFDGYYSSDIAAYANQASNGLPSMTLSNVLIDGFSGTPSFDNDEDAADIDMLASMAPGLSKIIVYEEDPFSPVDDLLNRIATDNCASQISCSWTFLGADAVTDQIFQQYALQGQSFFCASGDFGSDLLIQVAPPTGDPYITIVGGTVLATTTSNSVVGWQSETVWNGSSGGFDTNYTIPCWQAAISMASNQGSTVYRNLPDVAMCATNVFIIADDGQSEFFTGTSTAAPLWAGFTALVNQQAALYGNGPVGFINPAIYTLGASAACATNFHDIISGNNTNANSPNAYFAIEGYDLCTGWGSPNGSNLINALAPPDTLVMLPISSFSFTGPAGGPFNVTNESFWLTNNSAAPLNWSLRTDALWLSASLTNGTLSPHGTATVAVNLTPAAFRAVPGTYAARLWVTNLNNGLLHQRSCTLDVLDPLSVSPPIGFKFGGPPSGPFNAAEQICEITNASQDSVDWSVLSTPPWLVVSPGNGTLPPMSAAAVSCSLDNAATNLPPAAYSATVLFSNNTFGVAEGLAVEFLVGQLVENGGFETGDLSGWTVSGDTSHVSASSYFAHSGTYGVFLFNSGRMGYLSEALPTVPGQVYLVSLWLDSPYDLTPNDFQVSWAGNTVCNETNLSDIGWTNLQFLLLATNMSTALEIGFSDDVGFFGLDDVSVTAVPPAISNVAPASGPNAGGTSVTISGAGFQSHATVAFNSLPATSLTFNSPTNITVVSPPGAVGPANVIVTNADGQTAVFTNAFVFVGTPQITWTSPVSLVYGGVLGGGQLDTTASVPGTFAYNPPSGAILDAGTNALAAIFTPNDKIDYYSVTDYVSLVVTPAPLSVTASNATRPYGVTNPVFTGTITGLQNGDNITAIYSCRATSASPAETYPIVPTLEDPNNQLPNYQVSVFDGTLMVLAPVPPVVQTVSQSGNTVVFSWTATAGNIYQVQWSSWLSGTNWVNLNGEITATNSIVTTTDTVSAAQCFYRVLLVPQ